MKGLLIGLLAISSLSIFASDVTCFGTLNDYNTKLSIHQSDKDDSVSLILKVGHEDYYRGEGIVAESNGLEIVGIVEERGSDPHLLKLKLPKSFIDKQSALGSLILTVGSNNFKAQMNCVKSNAGIKARI